MCSMLSNENRVPFHRNLFAVVFDKLGGDPGFYKIKSVFPGGFDTLFINVEAIPTGVMEF